MKRKTRSRTERVNLFKAHDGICHICGRPIQAGEKWEWSHPRPLALGGDDTLENSAPAHFRCHRDWTAKEDQPRIAKAKVQEAKHIGAYVAKRPMGPTRGFPKRTKRGRIELENTLPPPALARMSMEKDG